MTARLACLLGVVLLAGCSKPTPNPTQPDKDKPSTPSGASAVNPAATASDATEFVKSFLAAVHEGTAPASQLTTAFKKVVTDPVFDADKSLGYSDTVTFDWLKRYLGKLPNPNITTLGGDSDSKLFTGQIPGEKPLRLAVRVIREGQGWLIDWFSVTEIGSTTVPQLTGAVPVAQLFAATAFLEALLGQNHMLAAGLMASDAKKRLAPAFPGENRPFNRGILDSKLNMMRGTNTGFKLTKVENGTITGEVIKADGQRPITIKLVPGERPFDWLVDEIIIN